MRLRRPDTYFKSKISLIFAARLNLKDFYMPVRIRLQRHGAKKRPFYFIVAADASAPRDGRYIEKLGTYDPLVHPAQMEVDVVRSSYWLQQGAQPTVTARRVLSQAGVLYWRHLLRGVRLRILDQAQAEERFAAWQKASIDKRSEGAAAWRAQKEAAVASVQSAVLDRAKEKAAERVKALEEATVAPVVEALSEADASSEESVPDPVA